MESLSVVIPAYNEAQTIARVAADVHHALNGRLEYEIIVVDDGSSDGTFAEARQLQGDNVRVLRHAVNRGSGQAIRTGLADARLTLATYVPADGQFDPNELPGFVAAAAGADIVVGYRTHRTGYGLVRKVQSALYVWLVNTCFGQKYRDVNWVHLWRVKTAAQLPLLSEGVFMQQELLTRAQAHGMTVVETPSEFHRRRGGVAKGNRPSAIWKTLVELRRFRRALKRGEA